ncbi:transporter substrate-binding domain-containing protein [Bacillus sp. V2I10]|uniref:transporter substrate-binding domain-containing protein n=1 Tax=Bacillus sp. V2I10 TaxID=3042276 RepID=UPI00277EEC3A|nr:transporter substrate-binding domain-containing protein [Bacillus sp. V2I10]MDQ0860980.1 PAS domain S-box-containing protein [Bacillus sp. V2I10]
MIKLNIYNALCLILFLTLAIFNPPRIFAVGQTYKIAGEWALPPFSYTREDGTLTGLSIDLMEKVAADNEVDFEYIPMSMHEAEQALQNGTVDAIAGMKYSVEKEKYFDFSHSYFTMSDSLIIPVESEDSIHEITDVKSQHVTLENRTKVLDTLSNMRISNLTVAANQYSGLLTLLKGRAEVFIGNKWTAGFYLEHLNESDQYIIRDEVIEPADYTIAVKEGNENLLGMVNHTLTVLEAKGELNTLISDWLMTKTKTEIVRLEKFIFLLTLVISAAALILLFSYIWNHRLKKAVLRKTYELWQLNKDLQNQQQKIADSHAFKNQILNQIHTGIVTFDLNFTMTSYNKRALEMFQFSADPALHDQHSDLMSELFIQYQSRNINKYDVPSIHMLEFYDNGQRKFYYYRMRQMYDSQDVHTGYLLSINDETEKKKLEQKLIIQEKLHALGQLVAGVAHEIRNPLTSIKTFIDMLPVKYDRPHFRESIIEHLPAEVNRLNMIVTDLLDYARPRQPNKQSYSSIELTSLLKFLHVTMDNKKIDFEQSINENLVFFIDPQQIRQVLLNLLLNAIDAVEGLKNKKIKISVGKVDKYYGQIIIEDTGKGINQEDLTHIFEPFYTSKEKGVGLGLTLSYNLVRENDGDILVKSCKNNGTVFTVILPLYEEERKNEAPYISHR